MIVCNVDQSVHLMLLLLCATIYAIVHVTLQITFQGLLAANETSWMFTQLQKSIGCLKVSILIMSSKYNDVMYL